MSPGRVLEPMDWVAFQKEALVGDYLLAHSTREPDANFSRAARGRYIPAPSIDDLVVAVRCQFKDELCWPD